jgi:hypothetical protein
VPDLSEEMTVRFGKNECEALCKEKLLNRFNFFFSANDDNELHKQIPKVFVENLSVHSLLFFFDGN